MQKIPSETWWINCEPSEMLQQLQKLMPDLEASTLARALEEEAVRAAAKDLQQTLRQMERCDAGSAARADWEATRDELLEEIRRLATRLAQAR